MKRRQNAKRKQKSSQAANVKETSPIKLVNVNIEDGCDVDDNENTRRRRVEIEPKIGNNSNREQEFVEKQDLVDLTQENCLSLIPERSIPVQTRLSKRANITKTKTLRDLPSLVVVPSKNTEQEQSGRTQQKKSNETRSIARRSSRRLAPIGYSDKQLPNQSTHQKEQNLLVNDPDYNEQELKALLAVIRNVMEMDAARPFNVPVDAVALGIPDYIDVIDTPMDFGTICNNLEKGFLYKNAKDVLKDVQQIWDNCCKYNKKGHPILELMKQVKRNFSKLWAEAQLYKGQLEETDGLMGRQQKSRCSARLINPTQASSPPLIPTPSQPVPAATTRTPSSPALALTPAVPAATLPTTPSSPALLPSPPAVLSSPCESFAGSYTDRPSGVKRKRSYAKPKEGWNSGKQIYQLQFNEFMQVVGPNQASFASQLGVLAKNGTLLPLTYTSWRSEGLEGYKNVVWEEIKRNTNCPEEFRDVCMKDLGTKWKNWKADVKKHYSKFATDEERLENCPPRVEITQWPTLVSWFGGEEAQLRSAQNKLNRNKQQDLHRTGRRPHAVIREKLKKEGKRHDRVEMYLKTRDTSDPVIAAKIAKMKELLATVNDEDQTTEFREQVFVEVLGPDRHGHVRTMGIGPTPSQVPGYSRESRPSQLLYTKVREELRDTLRVELEAEMKASLEATIQAREAEMLAREAERQASFEAQMREMKETIALLAARELGSCAQPSDSRILNVADVSARSGHMDYCHGGSSGKHTNQTTSKRKMKSGRMM